MRDKKILSGLLEAEDALASIAGERVPREFPKTSAEIAADALPRVREAVKAIHAGPDMIAAARTKFLELAPEEAKLVSTNALRKVIEAALPTNVRPLPALGNEAIRYLAARSPRWRRIFIALREYSMSNMVFSDDPSSPYPLVDLMSRNGKGVDIGDGEMEMVFLADEIEAAIEGSSDV